MISQWQLERVARVFNSGGVIAYPTESVYGLGCDPTNLTALEKILSIKHRSAQKGMIILVSDIRQAMPFLKPLSVTQLNKINQPQTRATTWLIPRKNDVVDLLCGRSNMLAVRVTQHPIARAICDYTQQALVSTSCNLSGKSEMTNVNQVRNHMRGMIDQVINGECGGQRPSQIIDLISDKIIRE